MSIEVITEIFHNASGEMEITANSPFLDALNGEGYFAKEPKFDSTEADLLALEVSHLDTQFSHQKMINVQSTGCRKAAG